MADTTNGSFNYQVALVERMIDALVNEEAEMPVTPMEVSSVAAVISATSLLVAAKAYRRSGARVRTIVRSVTPLEGDDEKLIVEFSVRNSGLAEVDVQGVTFDFLGYEAEITQYDMLKGADKIGIRLKGNQTFDFTVDLRLPLLRGLVTALEPAVGKSAERLKMWWRGVKHLGPSGRSYTPVLAVRLGNGEAPASNNWKLTMALRRYVPKLMEQDGAVMKKEIEEKEALRLKHYKKPLGS